MCIKTKGLSIVVLLTAGMFTASAEGLSEVQITTDPHNQYDPAIYGNYVVWTDTRNGNRDIYGFNLLTNQEFQITNDESDQSNPAIYSDIVVWEDERNGKDDIYGYNLLSNQEFQITTDPHNQSNPAIYSDIVVWTDYRNDEEDIYGYNLSTRKEFQITTDPEEQRDAAIYRNIVVWKDERDDNVDAIYGYNIKTKEEFRVYESRWFFFPHYGQYSPAIYEDIVLWTESLENIICSYNLSTSKKINIAAAKTNLYPGAVYRVCNPAIHNNIVVWRDYRNGNYDIYGYNLKTNQEFRITNDENDQYSPAIHNTMVVWTDDRNGKSDIYGFDLSSPVTLTVFTYRKQLFFLCFIYAMLAVVFTVIAARKAGKGPLDIKLQGDIKEFRRSTIFFIFPAVISLSSVLFVLFFVFWREDLFPFGFAWSFLFGISIYSVFWQMRTPYILITDDKIIIFKGLSAKEPIPWNEIQDITIQKRSIDIVISTGWKTKIRLFLIDKRDRKDLIQVFEHHAIIVENNSKPTVLS